MESSLGAARKFRRMEDGLEAALTALKGKDYSRAEQLLTELLALEQEENNGI
jgi:hypothetical protein